MKDDIYSILKGIVDGDDEVVDVAETQQAAAVAEEEAEAPLEPVAPPVEKRTIDAPPPGDFSLDDIMGDMQTMFGNLGPNPADTSDIPAPNAPPAPPADERYEGPVQAEEPEVTESVTITPADVEASPLSLDDILNAEAPAEEPEPEPANLTGKAKRAEPEKVIPMPTFTTEELADTLDIRNYASLVTLNTARWHGKVKDKTAAADAASVAGADPLAFETQKRLLAGADQKLKAVHKAIDDGRTRHYQMTLPWSVLGRDAQGKRTGGRLLPHTMFQEYITAMSKAKNQMDAALKEFSADYGNAVTRAKNSLGTRFDPSEYPNPQDIERHFGMTFDFHPVPIGDDFKGLADQQIAKLANTLQRKNRQMLENAMQETWARTYELVAQAADRFLKPEALFHYTLIDKLRDAATNLKNLNVTNDPVIERVRAVIAKHLAMHDADSIRKDEALRKHLGKIAEACVKEMNDHAASQA